MDSFTMGRQAAGGGRYKGATMGADMGFQALLQRLSDSRKEQAAVRGKAQEVVLENDPISAYGILGMEVPEDVKARQKPAGKPKRTQVTRGNTTEVYEEDEPINEKFLMSEYLKYSGQAEQNNATLSLIPKYKPRPVLPYKEWVAENFPDYQAQIFGGQPGEAPEGAKPASQPTSGTIKMKTTDKTGKVTIWDVPASKKAEAMKRGAIEVR